MYVSNLFCCSSSRIPHCLSVLILVLLPISLYAGSLEQAKRIHERLTGASPSAGVLQDLSDEIDGTDTNSDGITGGRGAALISMENDNFYRVTIKNWVAPWTNRDQNVFVPLNDYIATVMGYIHDERDFRGILFDDLLYYAPSITPLYSTTNNDHYEAIEATDPLLAGNSYTDLLEPSDSQTELTGVVSEGVAGVMTSRAAAEAFFVDGTNRAMFRYTLMNHMCQDLEQLQDATSPPDRVRQDVSRSPGGDSRVFSNTCVTCHGGMDPLAQAFAYYDFVNEDDVTPTNLLVYTPAGVPVLDEDYDIEVNPAVNPKYHINETTFPFGYRTPDDAWDNYWRSGVNSFLGWDYGGTDTNGSGNGAASLGRELANTKAFAQCQVEKVFQAVCLRDPANAADIAQVATMTTNFSSGYNLKNTFAEVADYCKGS